MDHLSDVALKKQGVWKNAVRNGLIRDVINLAPKDQQLIVFTDTLSHLKELHALCPEMEVCHAKLNKADRALIEQRFISGEALRVLSTNVLGEGVDPKKLMILVDCSATHGDSTLVQRRGRLRA